MENRFIMWVCRGCFIDPVNYLDADVVLERINQGWEFKNTFCRDCGREA